MSRETAGHQEIYSRIICIGNSLYEPDMAGYHVFNILSELNIPDYIEIIDGGLGGLNLLTYLEDVRKVIFVDSISGFLRKTGVTVIRLPCPEIEPGCYDHNAGIGYLIAMAPQVLESTMPDCLLVGIEGAATHLEYQQAVETCLDLAEQKI